MSTAVVLPVKRENPSRSTIGEIIKCVLKTSSSSQQNRKNKKSKLELPPPTPDDSFLLELLDDLAVTSSATQPSASPALLPATSNALVFDDDGNIVLSQEPSSSSQTARSLATWDENSTFVLEDGRTQARYKGAYKYTAPFQWSEKDVSLFWEGLSLHGTDLSMVAFHMSKNGSSVDEKEVRGKYKRESKKGNFSSVSNKFYKPAQSDLFQLSDVTTPVSLPDQLKPEEPQNLQPAVHPSQSATIDDVLDSLWL
jgi:Myb DNA-binding like